MAPKIVQNVLAAVGVAFKPKYKAKAPDTRWIRLCATLRCIPINPGAAKPSKPAMMNSTPNTVAMFFVIICLSL